MKIKAAKLIFPVLFIPLLLSACGAGMGVEATLAPTFTVPLETQTPMATALPMVAGEGTPQSTAEVVGPISPSLPSDAAVVLVGEGDTLNLRSAAGVGNTLLAELPFNTTNLIRTGATAFSGEESWAEVRTSTAETGWVNERYLTEYMPPAKFCLDPQVQFLLDNFLVAIQSENGELLSSLVSPVHGLDLRYFHYGTLANYSPEEATWVFDSTYEVLWGNAAGSGEEVSGTFSEVPLPRLLEVFGSSYELHCNDVGITSAFAQEPWPSEYRNINFYQVLKPGTEQYGGLDWRAWLVGIEYVQGKPYLFAMTSFEWTP